MPITASPGPWRALAGRTRAVCIAIVFSYLRITGLQIYVSVERAWKLCQDALSLLFVDLVIVERVLTGFEFY